MQFSHLCSNFILIQCITFKMPQHRSIEVLLSVLYHLQGNIVLTDHEYMILTILRPRTDQSEDVRFAVHQKYPVESAKQPQGLIAQEK
jgi:predicted ribosome quality control (RQC) complex YloA/Tae2 family protein